MDISPIKIEIILLFCYNICYNRDIVNNYVMIKIGTVYFLSFESNELDREYAPIT